MKSKAKWALVGAVAGFGVLQALPGDARTPWQIIAVALAGGAVLGLAARSVLK